MYKFFKQLLLLACLPAVALAQPVNDDCSGLIHLGIAPSCPDSAFFSNVGATASDIGADNIPGCFNGGNVERDVWFSFTSSNTIFNYSIRVQGIASGAGPSIVNPQVALYRGDCSANGMAQLACASAEPGADEIVLQVDGLTPNITYFLRINDYSSSATPNWGAFQLCIEEKQPDYTIDEGSTTACSGVLYDTGGPDGDYSSNENYTFTICPDQPHDCILFSLEYYFIEPQGMFGVTDQLTFFDGAQPSPANIIGQVGSFNFEDDGGGGVCYQVQASSGCLSVRFTSDNQAEFEGFRGRWQCSNNCEAPQPITVDSILSNQQIIDFVSTPATIVNIANINCPQSSYGTFESIPSSGLGLDRGLLLTTGSLAWAVGPNDDPGQGNPFADNGAPGDPDLDYLSQQGGNNFLSENACIVELDVFALTNELTFEYIFGSDEYQEYVGQEFNDIFAFFISGPGIPGDPAINNQLNIAVLPNGSNTPVEINSVNQLDNWQYYRNNNGGVATEYDGLTSDFMGIKKSLTARADVNPCNTYHLKLAIADRGDVGFDSGVFIAELGGGTPKLSVNFNSGIEYLVEDCTTLPDEIIISLSAPSEDTLYYKAEVGGTAIRNEDYLLDIPSIVAFPPGTTQLSFPIIVLSDLLTEPMETITILLANNFGCGEVVYSQLEITLHDALRVEINGGQDTAFICQDNLVNLHATGASSYFWSPPGIFDNPTVPDPVADPQAGQWVTVEGVLGPCVAYDSIFLKRIVPVLDVEALAPTVICRGDTVPLVAANNVGGTGLHWAPAIGLNEPSSENPMAVPQESTTYVATINITGCIVQDSVSIDVAAFDFPSVAADTTICENYGIQLAEMISPDSTTTVFQWTPSNGLNSSTIAGPLAFPETSTTYQLIGTAANGACADTAEVNITVLPADVHIYNPDTLEVCLGTAVGLSAGTTTGTSEGLLWSPADGSLSDTAGLEVMAIPEITTTYYATYTLGACTVKDSVFIRVDSLPALSITAEPEKEAYCQGESVLLTSPVYDPSSYPDIRHLWVPSVGFETADSLWNIVIRTQDTILYQRLTTNRGCRDTAEILLNVIEPPLITLTPQDTAICAGDSILLFAAVTGGTSQDQFLWQGSDGSARTGPSVAFGPTNPVTYTLTYISGGGCDTLIATLDVDVRPALDIDLEASLPGLGAPRQGDILSLTALANQQPPLNFMWTLNQDIIQEGAGLFDYEDVLIADPSVYTVFAENPVSGCRDSASLSFNVDPPAIEVPNAFTPNGDGYNDRFTYVMSGNIRRLIEFRVFNRWGQLVFDGNTADPEAFNGWDGTFKGKPQPSEVYFYLIRLERYDGVVEVRQGEVGLLR
ncbi:MAG: gliding motility-associated C-terminal domain-containing protein [Phaeodactylibacter sp.]|nr:gliding motility-associated C-terminal domain-containing protein [Phaeodactylibacter sp.]MCB9050146.1 gliding motility-associated C-terminal domain-containing protein [Lewinellaceae bacterium]